MRAGELAFLTSLAAFLVGFCLLGRFHYGYSPGLMLFPLLAAGLTLIPLAIQIVALARR